MELGIKLLLHFLRETELAQLGKDLFKEALLVLSQIVLCDFEQHWFGLPQVTTRYLTQQ